MNDLICPFCGAEQEIWEVPIPNPIDEVIEWNCDWCEKTFKWQFYIDVLVVEDDND